MRGESIMATIRKKIDLSKGITKEQKEMLKKAEQMEYSYDDDNPPLTSDELAQFKRVYDNRKTEKTSLRKQNVTLRLSPRTISKAKSFGKGYTSVLSQIVEKVLDNPEITDMLIKS